ncbi:Peptidyl-prolyl cis-trans isomerase cyp15 [Actinomortierella ambigua]|nr:Peptidyl-prolyl cis-trans isomerase cyp15 [Actinomortierella ambigua]
MANDKDTESALGKHALEEETSTSTNDNAAAAAAEDSALAHEKLFISRLPSAEMYERSYMHRDAVNFVAVTKTDFVITTSVDGFLKFWKKTEEGIEFVKQYRSHLALISGISVSDDGLLLATVAMDKSLKVYDVINFDMINMIQLDFTPGALCWVHRRGEAQAKIAIADADSPAIHVLDGRGDGKPLFTIPKLHPTPVAAMAFNDKYNCVLSADESGFMEYWTPTEQHPLPKTVAFQFKTQTDLFEFKKSKSTANSITFSHDFEKFVTMSVKDRQVRVWKTRTGKMIRKYDESLEVVNEMQATGQKIYKLDEMEFGRRLAVERTVMKTTQPSCMNAVFDESGHFLIYPTIFGIKVVNMHSNKVVRLIGKSEPQRFLHVALYQGAPKKKKTVTLAMAASDNAVIKESEQRDPTLIVTAHNRSRFYMFTAREPDHGASSSHKHDRDVFNEKPSREEQVIATAQQSKASMGSTAILRTTMGDITIKLFSELVPKTVENFVTHAKKGYYDDVIFHRIIKSFMLQTGDPQGDGTGGESIWGGEFEDEFHRDLRHDRAYTVSMANAGPNTNGSQFFITTVPTPWLDNKHTVFGRATTGMDVIHNIEKVKTDRNDKPYEEIKILNIEIR